MSDLNRILAENIRRERIASGITQRELAQKIGYSEKSVSKWEAGAGVPNIEILLKLAEIFKTDLTRLVYSQENEKYYLGIDGGGTKTHFALSDEDGNIIREHIMDASNPVDIGIENSKKLLNDGIIKITNGIPRSCITMFAGISGGTTGNNQKLYIEFFKSFGFKAFDTNSDIKNSVALGLGKSDGMIIIMGTGIAGFAVKSEIFKQIGGWGQLFDAGGSSYNLGRDGIYAVLREFDGTGQKTLLTESIEKRLGGDVKSKLGSIYEKGKKHIASFADLVISASEAGDSVARRIVETNMLEVAKIINAGLDFLDSDNVKIAFTGGLITKNPQLYPLISKNIKSKYTYALETITEEPVTGALKLARELDE